MKKDSSKGRKSLNIKVARLDFLVAIPPKFEH